MKTIVKVFLKKITSRKFILAVVASVAVFGNRYFEWGLNEADLWKILLPILTFIGLEGVKDIRAVK